MSSIAITKPENRPAISLSQAVIYLITYGGRGLYMPFISLYLLSMGFSPVELGIVTAISAFARLILVPAYSSYVDRIGAHRKLLIFQTSITGLSTIGMRLMTAKLWLGVMFLSRDIVDIPAAALMGQLTITSLRERGGALYGRLRAMGSLGWSITSAISGLLIHFGGYKLLILLSGVAYLCAVPLMKSFPERASARTTRVDKPPRRLPAFWLIMASCFLLFVATNAMGIFLFVYFRDLGADDALIGILAASLGLFEIPWMLGMNRIYAYMSTRTALMIGIAGQAVFFLSLSLIVGTAALFPLCALRGLFYALQNISLTVIVTEISHPANAATNQAITWVTIPAVATIIAGPVTGWIYEFADPRLLWSLVALIALFGALLLVVGRRMIESARAARLPLHVN